MRVTANTSAKNITKAHSGRGGGVRGTGDAARWYGFRVSDGTGDAEWPRFRVSNGEGGAEWVWV